MISGETYASLHSFYAADERRDRSPEWDFGVHWRGEHDWPRYRVSWIIETGELYAYRQGGDESVRVLGVVARVGEYPYEGGHEAWVAFKNEQPIEELLAGWADEPSPSLSWVVDRLATQS